MRISAISCWCSLLAAPATEGTASVRATTAANRPIDLIASPSLYRSRKPTHTVARDSSSASGPASSQGFNLGQPENPGALLRRHDEVRSTIVRPRRLVVTGIEGELLAVAHGL